MARTFNGDADAYITLSAGIPLHNAGNWSVAVWVYPVSYTAGEWAGILTGATTGSWGFGVSNLVLRATITNVEDAAVASATPALNQWTHVVVTYTDASNLISYYVAGVAAGTDTIVANATTTSDKLGTRSSGGADEAWDGRLAEFAAWSSLLSGGNITSLAAGARPDSLTPPPDLSYMPLCGIASPETDVVNARTGTLGSSVTAGVHPFTNTLCGQQSLRPDADVTTTGWTTTPLFSKLDEDPAGGDVVTATAS